MTSKTNISEVRWSTATPGFRSWEGTAVLGRGDEVWVRARREVLRWGVKTRSGFSVDPDEPVSRGDRPIIVARALGIPIKEPVEVIDVLVSDRRVGFAYRTLPGHPISGEEAFILHREDGLTTLVIRSLTRAGDRLLWRAAYPLLLLAQRLARRRYLRALRA